MLVLGIETSCDETSAALVEDGETVLSNVVSSQIPLHAPYRGVVPEIASRAHTRLIDSIVQKAFDQAHRVPRDVGLVAVTYCPGLIGSLLVGVTYAKSLAYSLTRPVVGVNHIAAHIYASCLGAGSVAFPLLALVVSGGHTLLMFVESHTKMRIVGRTLDDAAGEAFDKVASMLDLPYPGGPSIEKAALQGDPQAITFPRALAKRKDFDFSFSGLKTAVLYDTKKRVKKSGQLSQVDVANVAAGFQEAVCDVLVAKTRAAANMYHVSTILVCGGVAANTRLRDWMFQMCSDDGLACIVPPTKLCTDNAAMVAGLGYHCYQQVGDMMAVLDGMPRMNGDYCFVQ